jgi:hypothetical protein
LISDHPPALGDILSLGDVLSPGLLRMLGTIRNNRTNGDDAECF